MSKKIISTVLAIVFIIAALLMRFVFKDYIVEMDMEIAQFMSGFLFAVGVGILLRIYLIQRKIDSLK